MEWHETQFLNTEICLKVSEIENYWTKKFDYD